MRARAGPLFAWTCAGRCIEGRYSERTDRRRRAASSSSPCTTYTSDQERRSRPGMPRLIDLSDPVPCAPFLPTALKLVNPRRAVRGARRGREASQLQGLHSKITHGGAVLPGPSSNPDTNAVVLSPGRKRENTQDRRGNTELCQRRSQPVRRVSRIVAADLERGNPQSMHLWGACAGATA